MKSFKSALKIIDDNKDNLTWRQLGFGCELLAYIYHKDAISLYKRFNITMEKMCAEKKLGK